MPVTLSAELGRIRSVVHRNDPEHRSRSGLSAVVIPVVQHPAALSLLFTARSPDLPVHPGEMSFPGGRVERRDPDPRSGALRELQEETGIRPDSVDVVGHLIDLTTFRGDRVATYVGLLDESSLPDPPHVSPEVEEALLVPLAELRAPHRRIHPDDDPFRDARLPLPVARVAEYDARLLPEARPPERLVHYWKLDNGQTIWGITGHLLANFLTRIYGWRPPSAPRRIMDKAEVEP